MHQIRFSLGLCPEPRLGSSRRSPDLLVGWGGKYPFPIPHPVDAYSASFSAHTASRFELGGSLLHGLRGIDASERMHRLKKSLKPQNNRKSVTYLTLFIFILRLYVDELKWRINSE